MTFLPPKGEWDAYRASHVTKKNSIRDVEKKLSHHL